MDEHLRSFDMLEELQSKAESFVCAFDDTGDMVAFSREYKKQELNGTEKTIFMTLTNEHIYTWTVGGKSSERCPLVPNLN